MKTQTNSKMYLKKLVKPLIAMVMVGIYISCSPDDDISSVSVERDRAEQQIVDNQDLLDYLNSHYYNSSYFENNVDYSINDIIITELQAGQTVPDGNTLLIQAVDTLTTEFLDVTYEYYVLELNQGGGNSPNFTDSVRVRYEGFLPNDGSIFDSASSPIDLPLTGSTFGSGAITGWQRILPNFNSAENFLINNQGELNFNNFGIGVMFIPSGLGYYSLPSLGIPQYSNLSFKFELLQVEQNDHDGDGVPSYIEDLNNDLSVFDDDTDGNAFPNYVDADDDGDGVLTINENTVEIFTYPTQQDAENHTLAANEVLVSVEENTNGEFIAEVLILTDSNANGEFDYLESAVAIDNSTE